jgi:hypothetical protein
MLNKILTTAYAGILLVVGSICVIHTIITRTPADFISILKYIAPVAIFLFASNYSVVVNTGADGKITRYYPTAREALLGALMGSIFLIPIGVVILSVYSLVIDAVDWMHSPNLNSYMVNIISSSVVLVSGYSLFLFRKNYRSFYGATEVLIGVVIAMNNAQSLFQKGNLDLTLVFAFITAGIYLVVRGLDSIHEGNLSKYVPHH